jgi:uncharacterized membrane protein
MPTRKQLVIAIAALTAIALIITGIVIYHTAQADNHYNIVRLEIFKLCFIILLIVAAGAVSIMLVLKVKLEYIYLTAALLIGTAYMISITPLSVADEHHHYPASHIVSGYMMFKDDPFLADMRYFDFRAFAGHRNIPQAYLRFMDENFYILQGEAEYGIIYLEDMYPLDYPLWYVPQAVGISIGRIFSLSFFGVFILGRLFNLLFYSMCVTLSIKRLKTFKLPILIIGLLPMSLHQAASFSTDSFVNGMSMLFIAYFISCFYDNMAFKWRDYTVLLITGMLLAPAKMVYIPIIFLVSLVGWRWKEKLDKKAFILTTSILAASVIFAIILMGSRTIDISNATNVNWEGGTDYTLSFILANPIETMTIYLRTLYHHALYYITGMIGLYLSGLTIALPQWYILVFIVLLLAGVMYGKHNEWQPSIIERLIYFVICAVVVISCMTALLLGWTSDWHGIVLGIQGRYFLPILPLGLLVLRFNKLLIPKKLFCDAIIIFSVIMQSAVIIYILSFTINML